MEPDSILENVNQMLDVVRPGSEIQKRLQKYRDQLIRNVMLGPSALRFIREAYRAMHDSVECNRLTAMGRCRKTKMSCRHIDNNKECLDYTRARPQTKGSPLGRSR